MKLIVNTGPNVEPITLQELKNHLKIDFGTLADNALEDDALNDIITASRKHVEEITGRKLVTQTWDYYLNDWPGCDYIKLPFGNLSTVDTITVYDSTGGSTTFGLATGIATGFDIEKNGEGIGRIVLPYDSEWPTVTLRPSNPIKITFAAGYGTLATNVPSALRTAVKFEAQNMWRHGGEFDKIEKTVYNLTYNYRLHDEFS